jgi:hypothetical protein
MAPVEGPFYIGCPNLNHHRSVAIVLVPAAMQLVIMSREGRDSNHGRDSNFIAEN